MKTKRTLFSVAMLVVMVTFLLTGCVSNSSQGSFKTKISSDGKCINIYTNTDCYADVTISTISGEVLTLEEVYLDSNETNMFSLIDIYTDTFGKGYMRDVYEEDCIVGSTVENVRYQQEESPISRIICGVMGFGGLLFVIIEKAVLWRFSDNEEWTSTPRQPVKWAVLVLKFLLSFNFICCCFYKFFFSYFYFWYFFVYS